MQIVRSSLEDKLICIVAKVLLVPKSITRLLFFESVNFNCDRIMLGGEVELVKLAIVYLKRHLPSL